MTKREMYIKWLQNAYAMEVDITKTLEAQVDDAEDYPEVQRLIIEHLEETRVHAEKVKQCLEANGEDVSTLKEGMANVTGMMKGASMGMAHDAVVKNVIADFATEHMEIASYKALIETARIVGDEQSIAVFEDIIEDEENAVRIIEEAMPKLLGDFLETHD